MSNRIVRVQHIEKTNGEKGKPPSPAMLAIPYPLLGAIIAGLALLFSVGTFVVARIGEAEKQSIETKVDAAIQESRIKDDAAANERKLLRQQHTEDIGDIKAELRGIRTEISLTNQLLREMNAPKR